MEPIKMSPVFKQYIWGGDNIKKMYGKDTPSPPVAESWEISAHPDGQSRAVGGECDGMTIEEICKKYGREFYGNSMNDGDKFPLLLKILDANDRLSVQVHPDDAYAALHENGGKGKTEAWYILKAAEGAELIYGFKKGVDKQIFKTAIENGTVEDVLNKVKCNEGDVFYIPSGTVHAVGKGLVIAEIQQSSNTTYRVYDYERRDKDGNLRELHIDKALDVSCFTSPEGTEKTVGTTEFFGSTRVRHILKTEYFCFDEIKLSGDTYQIDTKGLLHMIFVAEGSAEICGRCFEKGDSILIPASIRQYNITGKSKLLLYYTELTDGK